MKKHFVRTLALSLFFVCCWGANSAQAAELPDLPPCEATVGNGASPLSIGIVQPHAAPDVVNYAVKLARQGERVTVCSESWSSVLPRFAPWAGHLERGYGFALYLAAFLAVVALLTAYTPRQQWRRTTLVGVLAVVGGSWLVGLILMFGFHALGGQRLVYGSVVSLSPAQQAVGEWLDVSDARKLEALLAQRNLLDASSGKSLAPLGVSSSVAESLKPGPQGSYRVFNRVNLREKPGVESVRLLVIARGQKVSYDGAVDGDWWRIKTESGQIGWASSIWLRRIDEVVPSAKS